MKNNRLADAVLVAALLLAYVPGLADNELPAAAPAALIAPAPNSFEVPCDDPAERL